MSSLIIPNCDTFKSIMQEHIRNSHECVKCGIRECKYNFRHKEFLENELQIVKKVRGGWYT